MRDLPWHPSQGPYSPSASVVQPTAGAPGTAGDTVPFPGEDADCCIARPLYRVVLLSKAGESPAAQLLLCGHHFRASIDGLVRASAAVFDAANRRVA